MALSNLKDVYIDQLQDLYSANAQAANITAELADAAHDTELKKALLRGVKGIQDGKTTLSDIITKHGAKPTGEYCKGMEGIVKEARAHALEADITDTDAKDAVIISQYQRMAHYAVAGYGCVVSFAERLGLDDEASKLRKELSDTYQGDNVMTLIAEDHINEAAAA